MFNLARNYSKTTLWYDTVALSFGIIVLIISLFIASFHKIGFYGVETDFYGAYVHQAENIISGQPYTYQHNPPGYMIMLAGVYLLTSDFFLAGKLISAFATFFFGWFTYLLFRALFDHRIALVIMIFLLLSLLPASFIAATDVISALTMVLPFWLLLRQPKPSYKIYFWVGFLAGIAYLVRYNAVCIMIGIGFSLLFILQNQEKFWKRLLAVNFFGCGFLLMTSPWFVYNWKTNGSPFSSTLYVDVAMQYFGPGDGLGTSFRQAKSNFNSIWDVFWYNPLILLKKYLIAVMYTNIKELTALLRFPLYLFAGAGFLILLKNQSNRWWALFATYIFGYLMLGLTIFSARFYYFHFPFLFLMVAYFLFHKKIIDILGHIPFSKVTISWLIVVIFAIFLVRHSYEKIEGSFDYEPRYLFKIADFIKNRSSPGELIIVRKPHLAYLTGLKRVFPLLETPTDYSIKAKELGVRYIVYSDFEAELWPGLKFLRYPETVPEDFKLIYSHEPTHTLVYEIDVSDSISRTE